MSDGPNERENLTAALVRDYDDGQLVEWIHALQDREEELEAEVERLRTLVALAFNVLSDAVDSGYAPPKGTLDALAAEAQDGG